MAHSVEAVFTGKLGTEWRQIGAHVERDKIGEVTLEEIFGGHDCRDEGGGDAATVSIVEDEAATCGSHGFVAGSRGQWCRVRNPVAGELSDVSVSVGAGLWLRLSLILVSVAPA